MSVNIWQLLTGQTACKHFVKTLPADSCWPDGESQQTHTAGGEAAELCWFHSAVPERDIKSLPAWIRVADCWRAWRLRRWYRSQQHWMVKAHRVRVFFLWSSSKSSCKTTSRHVSTLVIQNYTWRCLCICVYMYKWLTINWVRKTLVFPQCTHEFCFSLPRLCERSNALRRCNVTRRSFSTSCRRTLLLAAFTSTDRVEH